MFLSSITTKPVLVCILFEWTTFDVTTFGLFLFGEGDFEVLGVGSSDGEEVGAGDGEEIGAGDGEEVGDGGQEGGTEYLPPKRLFFLMSS